MDERNILIKENIKAIMDIAGIPSMTKLSEKTGNAISTKGISKIINHPEESNPRVSTLRIIGNVIKAEPWMLLVKHFPFHKIKKTPISEITEEGYTVLHAFETATPETKKAILEQIEFLVGKRDGNYKEAHYVAESLASYGSCTEGKEPPNSC